MKQGYAIRRPEDSRTRRSLLTIEPAAYDPTAIEQFMTTRGAGWGARRDVVHRAASALRQLVETQIGSPETTSTVNITLSFDPSNLDIQARIKRAGQRSVATLHFDH